MQTEIKPDSRRKILDAAIAEFALRGYEAASTNRICQQADISKGLLFHYYKSKHRLFAEVIGQCVEDMEEADPPPAGGYYTEEEIQECCRRQLRFFAGHFAHYAIIGELLWNDSGDGSAEYRALREELLSRKAARFRCFLRNCRLRPEVDREVALELLLGATDQIQKKYLARIRRQCGSAEVLMREFLEEHRQVLGMLLHGIVMEGDHASRRN